MLRKLCTQLLTIFCLLGVSLSSLYPKTAAAQIIDTGEAVSGYRLPWPSGQKYQVTGVRTAHVRYNNVPRQSIDFGTPWNTPVLAMKGGDIVYSKNIGGATNGYVIIDHNDGYCSVYVHLSSLAFGTITSGRTAVTVGKEIGRSGRLGANGAIHLHVAVYTRSGSSCGYYSNSDKQREAVIIFDEIGRELNYNDWVTSANKLPAPQHQPHSPTEIILTPTRSGSGWVQIQSQNTVYCTQVGAPGLYYNRTQRGGDGGAAAWHPSVTISGYYQLYAYLPDYTHTMAITSHARYWINHADIPPGAQSTLVILDQNVNKCGWTYLGTYRFEVGGDANYWVYTGNGNIPYNVPVPQLISADVVKMVLVGGTGGTDSTRPDGYLSSPAQNVAITGEQVISLKAEAWDNAGGSGVDRVEFHVYYDNAWHSVGTDSSAPYQVDWQIPTGLNSQWLITTIHVIDRVGNEVIDPGGYRYVKYTKSASVSLPVTCPSCPPVLLVHGFLGDGWGDTCSTSTPPFHYGLNPLADDGKDGHLKGYFAEAKSHLGQYFDIWLAHVSTGPTLNDPSIVQTPSLTQNAACLKSQIDAIYAVRQQKVIVIGHSMGGVLARLCAGTMAGCSSKISRIITVGSPNAGINDQQLDVMKYLFPASAHPGLYELSNSRMIAVNSASRNLFSIGYGFLGGTYWFGNSDIAIDKYSAMGWLSSKGIMFPSEWDKACAIPPGGTVPVCTYPNRYWTPERHDNFFNDVGANQASVTVQCLLYELGKSSSRPVGCDLAYHSSAQNESIEDEWQKIPAGNGVIPGGLYAIETIMVDANSGASFVVDWTGGGIDFSLTDASFQSWELSDLDQSPGEVQYHMNAEYAGLGNQIRFDFPSAAAGEWLLTISNRSEEEARYNSFALVNSPRQLTIDVNKNELTIASTLQISASLTGVAGGIPGAALSANLMRANGITDTLTLQDQGNGLYRGEYLVPDAPGHLLLTVDAQGNDQGMPFNRQENLVLTISPQSATIAPVSGEQPLDLDGNQLFEALRINTMLDVQGSGTFMVLAELLSGDRVLASTSLLQFFAPGSWEIVLDFVGSEIYAAGANGPYQVRLHLTQSDLGDIPLQSPQDLYLTNGYDYRFFGSVPLQRLYLPVVVR